MKGFSEILLYKTANGNVKVEIFIKDESLWLAKQNIAGLFGVERSLVTKHIGNIYYEAELINEATNAKIAQVKQKGIGIVNREIEFYNLDAII